MGVEPKIKVAYFNRKPRLLGNFSVETYYKLIREALPPYILPLKKDVPFESNGLVKRLANAVYCAFNQERVNHITGDIHYVAVFLRKRKTVLTILDCGMLEESSGLKHLIFKYLWFIIPIKKSKTIVAISSATKDDIIKYTKCRADKIKVIYIAISTIFKKQEKIFNSKKPRILQIGTAPNKNIERLVAALNGIDCTLVIIGKVGSNITELTKLHQVECEIFDRRLTEEEIVEEYNKCDILAFVSTLEGFGMPIIEANAVGRAVITSNISSMPEIAANAACLVDPFNVKSIHKAFKEIIANSDYRNELIVNGFENAKRFSIQSLAEEHAKLYSEMA